MAELSSKRKTLSGLRPVIILSVAVAFLLKTQRSVALESQEQSSSTTTTESPVCPGYCNLAPDRATRFKAPFRRWYFDADEGECKRFRWGGRGGNKNRFLKKADCEETCSKCSFDDEHKSHKLNAETLNDAVCSQPVDEGRCPEGSQVKQPQLVWHFNSEKAKCAPIINYGCGDTQNRFENREECEETCH